MHHHEELPPHVGYVPLSQLEPWERNYRVGDVEAIVRSVGRFGFNGALRVRFGVVMAGNQSFLALKAMQERGADIPRGIVADPAGGWLVPTVDISHLSDEEAMAFAVADNKTQELGRVDEAALASLLSELLSVDADLATSTGFSTADLDQILGETGGAPAGTGAGAGIGGSDDDYQAQYGVIVVCRDEAEQEKVYEDLLERGYQCKVVVS